jgi:type IX secretion system PorP/SprF family membrane protein
MSCVRPLVASLCFFIGLVTAVRTHAQDVEFTQFVFNPIHLNPGLAGSSGGPRFILNYRSQWPAFDKAFVTYTASYDQHISAIRSGIGVQLISDNQANGLFKQTGAAASYNYLLRATETVGLRLGLRGGFMQSRIQWEDLLFYDQFDLTTAQPVDVTGEELPSFTKKATFDIGAGALLYGRRAYAGISVKHINQPNLTLYESRRSALPMRFLGNIGAEIRTKRKGRTYISPNLMYARQGTFNQIQGHLLVYRGPVILGMGMRHASQNTDALMFYVGLKQGIFRTVYSYDNTFSNIRGKTGGAHELSISLNFSESRKAAKKRRLQNSIECPDLFY